MLNLDSVKTSQDTNIPTKLIKDNANIFSDFYLSDFINWITTSIFPSSLKQGIATPVFKKGDKNLTENYWPVSTLPNVLKIFERLFRKQISNFMETFFSKQQSGFQCSLQRAFYLFLKNENQWSIKHNILVHFWQIYY